MNQTVRIPIRQPAWKRGLAAGMMLLLLWLTSINFLYLTGKVQSSSQIACLADASEDEEASCNMPGSPTGPDEKTPDAPISIIEEYIHEHAHTDHTMWFNMLLMHKVHEAEKLTIFHPESFSPPPEA